MIAKISKSFIRGRSNRHGGVQTQVQLHLLSQGKGTWTSAGHLVRLLRRDGWIPDLAQSYGNPFLLGVDALALLRQVIALDGFMIRELLRVLLEKTPHSNSALVTRDDIVKDFVSLVGKSDRGASKLLSLCRR
jgi:hypothetical protein